MAGPISLLGYLRVEVFGAEDHGVVDTQVGPRVCYRRHGTWVVVWDVMA